MVSLSPSSGTKFAQVPIVDFVVLNQLFEVVVRSFTLRSPMQPLLEHCLAILLSREASLHQALGLGNPVHCMPLEYDPSQEHLKQCLICDGNEDTSGSIITTTSTPLDVNLLFRWTSIAKPIEKLTDNLPIVVLICLEGKNVDDGNVTIVSLHNRLQ